MKNELTHDQLKDLARPYFTKGYNDEIFDVVGFILAVVEADRLSVKAQPVQPAIPALLPLLKTAFRATRVCGSEKQYELVFSFTDIPALHAAEEEWDEFRVAALSQLEQPTDKFWCETCEGFGYIDETLGGEPFSNPKAKCPDCDGKGYWFSSGKPVPPKDHIAGVSNMVSTNTMREAFEKVKAERDQALAASRWETDLCNQALAYLKLMIENYDSLKADLAALRVQSAQHMSQFDKMVLQDINPATFLPPIITRPKEPKWPKEPK